jgi:hypothetical protein
MPRLRARITCSNPANTRLTRCGSGAAPITQSGHCARFALPTSFLLRLSGLTLDLLLPVRLDCTRPRCDIVGLSRLPPLRFFTPPRQSLLLALALQSQRLGATGNLRRLRIAPSLGLPGRFKPRLVFLPIQGLALCLCVPTRLSACGFIRKSPGCGERGLITEALIGGHFDIVEPLVDRTPAFAELIKATTDHEFSIAGNFLAGQGIP